MTYRSVVPVLHASFRVGGWYNIDDIDSGYFADNGLVGVVYDEDETDINNYICVVAGELQEAIEHVCRMRNIEGADHREMEFRFAFDPPKN